MSVPRCPKSQDLIILDDSTIGRLLVIYRVSRKLGRVYVYRKDNYERSVYNLDGLKWRGWHWGVEPDKFEVKFHAWSGR